MNQVQKILFLLILTGALFSHNLLAQSITGTVHENTEKGQVPLIGANVYWSNTQNGTTTDTNGFFKLEKEANNAKLVISFIGYQNDTLTILKHQKPLKITLSQGSNLEEVLITQRRAGTFVSRVDPILTNNITGDELCRAACCNLAESFSTNPSVDVSYSDAATGAKQIQLLGLSGTYVQMLTENMPNFRGLASLYGLSYIPGPWMDAISVSKGSSSVINGYESVTGQINVEYKKPEKSEKFYINLFASDAGRMETNVNGGARLNDKWSTMVLAHFSDNSMMHDDNEDGFLDQPMTRQYNFINRWSYKGNGITSMTGIKVLDESRESGQKDFYNSSDPDAYGIGIDTRRYEFWSKNGYVLPGDPETSVGLQLSGSYHEQNSFFGTTSYDADQTSGYANLIFQSHFDEAVKHKFSTGASLQYDQYKEELDQDPQEKEEVVPGLFFQYTYHPNDAFVLMAGIRADHHNQYGSFVTPRFHLKWDPWKWFNFRVSAGKGFRSPNILAENSNLLASSRKMVIIDQPDQEEAWNFGVNATTYIPMGSKDLTVTTEFYRTNFLNQVVVDMNHSPDEIRFYNLDGTSYSNSFQVEAKYELFRGMDLTAAYRITDVKQTIDGKLRQKPLTNKYKGLLTASYQTPLKKWQFDFTSQLNGGGRMPDAPSEGNRPTWEETFDPYTIFNGQITKFFRTWEIYIGAENLSNFKQKEPIIDAQNPFGDYFDSSMVWGPIHGRKVYIGLRFSIDRD